MSFLSEQSYNSKIIMNVDIQPEYEKYFKFNKFLWIDFLNSNHNNTIIFLYNGENLGMIDENEYRDWLYELGLDEEILENCIFFDKGYAFYRYCIDNYIEEEHIINLIKFMYDNDIRDSRDFDESNWDDFISNYNFNNDEIRTLLEFSDDTFYIPELMDFLEDYNDIVLTGGGLNECLKEVELSLLALEKDFNILVNYTY